MHDEKNKSTFLVSIIVVGVVICLLWIGTNEYREIRSGILATGEQVQELTDETRLTLKSIRDTIDDLRKKIFRLEHEYAKLETQLSKPASKSVPIKKIVVFSLSSCGACNTWKSTHKKDFERNGFEVSIVDDVANVYPTHPVFEITDGTSTRVIEGVLPWSTYQELSR